MLNSVFFCHRVLEYFYVWREEGKKYKHHKDNAQNDLWKKLDVLFNTHEVEFIWVRGHDGHAYNERCDHLATEAADSFKVEG